MEGRQARAGARGQIDIFGGGIVGAGLAWRRKVGAAVLVCVATLMAFATPGAARATWRTEGDVRGSNWPRRAVKLIVACLLVAAVAGANAGIASATTITAFPVDFSATEAASFSGAVATFEDDNPSAAPGDFTATIDWGDGSATTAGTVMSSGAAFTVTGTHTYTDEGSFTVTVTISDVSPGTGTATATDTATVTEADALSGSAVTSCALAGTSFTDNVAGFTDSNASAVVSDFTATIDWGDATTSAGTVSGGGGSFNVSGTHTYAGSGTFSVTVTLSDDVPGTATAQVTSTMHVGGAGVNASGQNATATEGIAAGPTLACVTDSRAGAVASDFTANIDWGDGQARPAR